MDLMSGEQKQKILKGRAGLICLSDVRLKQGSVSMDKTVILSDLTR
jgi:hypothetical protein